MRESTAELKMRALLLQGAAEAYGYSQQQEDPCSACGCPSPASEASECDRADCPLEGRP